MADIGPYEDQRQAHAAAVAAVPPAPGHGILSWSQEDQLLHDALADSGVETTAYEDATPGDRALFEADRIARTFHLRKDAVEVATAWVADVHGRLWSATKARGKDGIEESFFRPGNGMAGGQMVKALLEAARDYGSAE